MLQVIVRWGERMNRR